MSNHPMNPCSSWASHFTLKYKAYKDPPKNPSHKMLPSEQIRDASNPFNPYNDNRICPKPQIIEHHNFVDQPYQLTSSVPEDEPLFQPYPPELIFSGYRPFEKYMSVLHLRNNDKVVRRVQVLPREPAYLSVQLLGDEHAIYTEIGSSKVACGMEVAYTVTFHPESDGDYALALVVITDREKFLIPVRCKGLKAVLDLPDEISFPPTPAKCCYKKNVMIHNVGNKRALFMLESRGAFHVNSSDFEVEPGSFVQCCVHFLPSKACNYEGELEICFKDDDKRLFSRLLGTGSELDVGLSAGVASALPTYIRKSSQITLQIFNRSAVVAYFIWTKFATRGEMEEYKEQIGGAEFSFELEQEFNIGFDNDPNMPLLEHEKNLLCDMDKAFTITPAKGEVWPGTLVEIAINFCPQKALRYVCTTFCTISGKSNSLPLQVQGLGIGPHIQFVPCELDLGEISLYSRYVYDVTLENVSELEVRKYWYS